MSKVNQLNIRLIDAEGKETDTKEIIFNAFRLRRSKAKELSRKSSILTFAEYDPNSVRKSGDIPKMINMDLAGMSFAEEDVWDELTLIVWNCVDLNIDDIHPEDYDKMLEICKREDPLKLQEKRENAKKKLEKITETKSQDSDT